MVAAPRRETLSILIALVENGVNPEALAAVVKELRREAASLKVRLTTRGTLPPYQPVLVRGHTRPARACTRLPRSVDSLSRAGTRARVAAQAAAEPA